MSSRAPTPEYLRTLSATQLARAIRERETTSRAVVDAHIARIGEVNPTLNAVVVPRFDRARAEADRADAAIDAGQSVGPLHGVPCTIKESFAVEGMPQTAGLVARRGHLAGEDATTVARLRAAGAIPMGTTNTSELCMWLESNNHVYGRTSNPYDPSRIVGGSSGGEGAIIGAGASPFGLGSDVGGSIRMPAFFNGVFGHKPSSGLVPNTGQFPTPAGAREGRRYLVSGPLARSARDLPMLLSILAGPDGECDACEPMALEDTGDISFRGRRVLNVSRDGTTPVSSSLRRAQQRAADHFAALGADVQEPSIPALRHALEIWSSMMGAANDVPFASLLGEGTPVATGRELARWALGRSPHTLPALGLALVEKIPGIFPKRVEAMLALGAELRETLAELLGPDGVMLYPSYAESAPRHGRPLLPPTRWAYTAILNVLEMPATQVPMGLDERGLPTGVQVAAAHGRDHLCLAGAITLEAQFGGWVRPRT